MGNRESGIGNRENWILRWSYRINLQSETLPDQAGIICIGKRHKAIPAD
ncbi:MULTISPECIES: hypothetical protein [unclassified Roseofilum]|nr:MULTISPECIES: hypothetical protein [unclassified Roseofilum]MBP0010705.1 hypothetical protein [Roseofilum sp. Belize Diploria]MBP0013225.1 hypothetical protein [Roseofilum sp. SID3]MBP0025989.1 hypothetical protein [Roseofilum sp. SID2]MBP0035196.1 hypothetical protein [Roseofilum sp. Belize BBD 4]MBP0037858.1 hypothetical protein [Roseofilum sp. SID1]